MISKTSKLLAMAAFVLGGLLIQAQSKYKCMIQMAAYTGDKAYVVVSLINPKNQYEKTLAVMGQDKKWYNSLKEWHKVQNKKPEALSAITGASVSGGDRSMVSFILEDAKLDKGYKIRFESAVEDQKYHSSDIEIPYSKEALLQKSEGKNYIKFVKFSKSF